MIEESDNGAAYLIFGRVGVEGMRAVAKAAGLRDYEQGSEWIDTRDSAADQARFLYGPRLASARRRTRLARRLLSGVIPIQRWGIPAAAGPPGWTCYFKGGWLGMDNKLMVQAAWLEKGGKRVGRGGDERREPPRGPTGGTRRRVSPGCCWGRSRRRRTSQSCWTSAQHPAGPVIRGRGPQADRSVALPPDTRWLRR